MLTYIIKKNTTSRIISIPVYDSSSSVGAKLSGLLYNTSSLVCYYDRLGASGAPTSVTLATMTKGTWTSGGFIAKGTGMSGWYDFGIPDAAIVAGADEVVFEFSGAANMVPVSIRIKLVDNEEVDSYSLLNNETYGLSAIETLVDGVESSLASGVTVSDKTGFSLSSPQSFNLTGNIAGNLSGSVGSVTGGVTVTTNNDKTGYSLSTSGVTAVQSGLATSAEITALHDISVADILAGETETGLTLKHAMQIITALALKATGGGTSSISFRNYGDTKNRLTMTVDEDGNRTAVTINLD